MIWFRRIFFAPPDTQRLSRRTPGMKRWVPVLMNLARIAGAKWRSANAGRRCGDQHNAGRGR